MKEVDINNTTARHDKVIIHDCNELTDTTTQTIQEAYKTIQDKAYYVEKAFIHDGVISVMVY